MKNKFNFVLACLAAHSSLVRIGLHISVAIRRGQWGRAQAGIFREFAKISLM